MRGRKNLQTTLFTLFVFISTASAFGLNLTRLDMSHLYDPDAPVKLQYRVTQNGDVVTIYMLISTDSASQWTREFFIQEGYASEEHRVISPKIIETEKAETFWRGSIQLKVERGEELLVVNLISDFNFYFDIPLVKGRVNFPSFSPVVKENPLLTSYVATSELGWKDQPVLEVTSYTGRYGPADAPMDEMRQLAPTFYEDSTYLLTDKLILHDYSTYFFRNDTLDDSGIGLMKVPPYYPSFRLIGELIPPMKYITTDAEFRTLTGSNRLKRTFDEFWINTYGTKFRARNAIRKYFKSVEYANEYFTTYKQGWKTDRGMILIAFGTPYEMYRSETGEIWVYEDIEFEFIKVASLFGDDYVLRKDRKYEKDWYKQISKIRKGE